MTFPPREPADMGIGPNAKTDALREHFLGTPLTDALAEKLIALNRGASKTENLADMMVSVMQQMDSLVEHARDLERRINGKELVIDKQRPDVDPSHEQVKGLRDYLDNVAPTTGLDGYVSAALGDRRGGDRRHAKTQGLEEHLREAPDMARAAKVARFWDQWSHEECKLMAAAFNELQHQLRGWQPIATAPKNGTLVLLLIEPDGDRENALEDTAEGSRTVGHNNFDNDGEDKWEFAGWCWSHDHYTEGHGTPSHWQPLPVPPSTSEGAPHAHQRAEIERLREQVREHNDGCEAACNAQRPNERQSGGCGYQKHDGSQIYSRRCPNCPRDWMIDCHAATEPK